MDFVVVLIGVVLVMLIGAAVIAVWATATAWRWFANIVNGVRPDRSRQVVDAGPRCPNAGCRSPNPTHAQFCRRCGSAMSATAYRTLGPMRYPVPDTQRVAV